MIAGALEFSLGLQANQFLNQIGLAGKGLLGFVGLASGIEGAFHKMWAAVEKGGNLQDLATRTNTSVKSLYSLQQAFEQIGASADSAAPLILKMQRVLTDQEGGNILQSLGLDPAQLRGQESVDQINAVAEAIAKLNPSQQAGAAFNLFGREGASTILLLARSGQDFQKALAATRGDAAIWQKVAEQFDNIGDNVNEIKGHMNTMWAGFTSGFAPALQSITDGLKNLDLGGIGLRLGKEVSLVFESINLEKFEQYFTLSLQSGVQEVSNFMMQKIIEWGIAGEKAMQGSGKEGPGFWSKLGSGTAGVGVGMLGLWNVMGASVGIPGADAMADKRIDQANRYFEKAGLSDGVLNKTAEAFVSGMKGEQNPFTAPLAALRAELQTSANARVKTNADQPPPPTGGPDDSAGKGAPGISPVPQTHQLSDVTNLEKMGAIFGGLGRGFGQDHARQTSENTRRTADILQQVLKALPGITGAPQHFTNI